MTKKTYENPGLLTLIPPSGELRKTLVVMGVARSGTSMVAGCLHELGVFMGDQARSPVYEDLALSMAVEKRDTAAIRQLVRRYDQQYSTWGWKRPASLHHMAALQDHLRNPHYIVVFRDLFAIANRNRISVGAGLLDNMQRSIDEYQKLLDNLQLQGAPCLLVSYEKALHYKENFIDTLCDYCGLQPPGEVRIRALDFVSPSPTAYLHATRAGQVIGHIDVVDAGQVLGWAAQRAHAEDPDPVVVSLEVNRKKVAETLADVMRPDLVAHGVHATGRAGFVFDLVGQSRLKPGDEVRVYCGEHLEGINGSPWLYEPTTGA